MTGRKLFAPSDDQRGMVRAMAGYGVPHDDIALVVKCSPPTLWKRFRQELDVATIEANTRVAQTLYQQATTPGNCQSARKRDPLSASKGDPGVSACAGSP